MGMGQKPDIWTRDQFKAQTGNKKTRTKLLAIDNMLVQWDGVKNGRSTSQRVAHLQQLAQACIDYIRQQKAKKARKEAERDAARIKVGKGPSDRLVQRIQGTEDLLKQVMIRLAYEQCQFQKTTRVGQVGTTLSQATRQGLQPGYAHERTAFLAMKAQGNLSGHPSIANPAGPMSAPNGAGLIEPVGSSYLRDCHEAVRQGNLNLQGGNALFNQNFVNTPFAQLTDAQLDAFGQYLTQMNVGMNEGIGELPQVHFARKDERINKNMLVPLNGKLYTSDGALYSTRRGTMGKLPQNVGHYDRGHFMTDMYAMDKYGNLFHQLNPTGQPFSDTSQWNHSSLVAGGEVICAGVMIVENGDLLFISNESGHYQPNIQKLSNAIGVLIEEYGLDLVNTLREITDLGANQTYGNCAGFLAQFPPE